MTSDKLQSLRIPSEAKDRSQKAVWLIFLLVGIAALAALYYAWPRESDNVRKNEVKTITARSRTNAAVAAAAAVANPAPAAAASNPEIAPGTSLLTVSGYII